MTLWTFKCYSNDNISDPIGDWYNELPDKAQAKLDSYLDHFSDNQHNDWGVERIKPLVGYDGILEIRFSINKILYRPLGYFGPKRNEFTFLFPAREQGDKFVPKSAPTIAKVRMKEIEEGKAFSNECSFY